MQCRGVTDKPQALQTHHTHTHAHNFHQQNFIKRKWGKGKNGRIAWYEGKAYHEELLFGKGENNTVGFIIEAFNAILIKI